MWGEIAQAAASTVNTALNLWGAEKAQDTDVQMFHEANAFNAQQAALQRQFGHEEAEFQRNFNWASMAESMNFNSRETEKNRQFNKLMAETEYQRAVADLGKAGLNPMLAYMKGGTSVPGSSAASSAAASSGLPSGASASSVQPPKAQNILGHAAHSALQGFQVAAGLERMQAETRNIEAQTQKTIAEIPKVEQETRTSASSAKHLDMQVQQIQEVIPKIRAEIQSLAQQVKTDAEREKLYKVEAELKRWETVKVKSETELQQMSKPIVHAHGMLMGNQIPRSENERNAQETWWMKNVSPFLPDALKSGTGLMLFKGLEK